MMIFSEIIKPRRDVHERQCDRKGTKLYNFYEFIIIADQA